MSSSATGRGKIIAITSVKGGVGKTTIATNLGLILSKRFGLRVLVIDGDLKLPTVGFHLNIIEPGVTLHDFLKNKSAINLAVQEHKSGLHVILGSLADENISSQNLREGILEIAKQYDYVILDTSPSIDEDLRNLILSSDEVLVVSGPDYASISGSMKAIKLSNELSIPVRGVVINRSKGVDSDLTKQTAGILEARVLASVPEDAKVREALTQKQPISLYSPNSPAGREMTKLAAEVAGVETPGIGIFSRLIYFIKNLFGR